MVNKNSLHFFFQRWAAGFAAIFFPSKIASRHRGFVAMASCALLVLTGALLVEGGQAGHFVSASGTSSDGHQAESVHVELPATSVDPVVESTQSSTSIVSRSRVHIEAKSSTNRGGEQKTTMMQSEDGQTQTITKQSEDGSASVTFEVQTGANAEVEVRDRGNRIDIEVNEEQEF